MSNAAAFVVVFVVVVVVSVVSAAAVDVEVVVVVAVAVSSAVFLISSGLLVLLVFVLFLGSLYLLVGRLLGETLECVTIVSVISFIAYAEFNIGCPQRRLCFRW